MNLKLRLLPLALLTPFYSFGAGHVIDAKITSLYCGYVEVHQMCSITFNKPIQNKDACHTGSERMQLKPDTEIGKAMLSIALAAQVAQKNVNVYSTGKCTIFNGFADVNWVTIRQ